MIGRNGTVIQDFTGRGRVEVDGESWIADSDQPLTAGQKIRVEAIDKLVLKVKPKNNTHGRES
jgi:membrane protein implicated in regulation of membrane protease activity